MRSRTLLLALSCLLGPAVMSAPATAATTSSGSAGARATTTSIVIDVTGCDECRVRAVQGLTGKHTSYWHTRNQVVGSDHQLVFSVPTSRTRGMSFEVRAPWQSAGNAVPNVVTKYAGHRKGAPVTSAEAAAATRATGCWAGTGRRSAHLSFVVEAFADEAPDGSPGLNVRAWASPGLKKIGKLTRTYQGMVANQDAYYCPAP